MVSRRNKEEEAAVELSGIGQRRLAAQKDTSNASYQQRREEIFRAAGLIFKRKGFRGASLGDIAKELGTDRANLYYYVSSKQEIIDGVVSTPVRENLERLREIAASDKTAPEKIRELIVDLMLAYDRHYPGLYVFIQENLRHISTDPANAEWAAEMREINREYQDLVVAIVEEGSKDGSLKVTGEPWVVAYGIIGMVAWSNRWYDPSRTAVSAQEIADSYADLVLQGLQAPSAERS